MPASDVGPLLQSQTVTGPGATKAPTGPNRTYLVSAVANAGASGAASIDIEASNDASEWVKLGTVTFSSISDTKESDGFSSLSAWKYLRANVVSISGAGMTIDALYGVNQ